MLETSLNVWSDSCVAKVVNEKLVAEEGRLEAIPDTLLRAAHPE
jgi:hypothetical protein